MSAIAVRFDAVRTLAAGAITGTYATIGAETSHLMRIIHVVNQTNANIFVSFDGFTDNIFVPAGSFVLYDFESDAKASYDFVLQLNTQMYVRSVTTIPTTGSVYIMCIYGKGE
jgi:hypothetical protein